MSLNPCCGGRCSSTMKISVKGGGNLAVLILVVVEDVLVLVTRGREAKKAGCLNPCCGGRCSSTTIG